MNIWKTISVATTAYLSAVVFLSPGDAHAYTETYPSVTNCVEAVAQGADGRWDSKLGGWVESRRGYNNEPGWLVCGIHSRDEIRTDTPTPPTVRVDGYKASTSTSTGYNVKLHACSRSIVPSQWAWCGAASFAGLGLGAFSTFIADRSPWTNTSGGYYPYVMIEHEGAMDGHKIYGVVLSN